MRGFVCDLEGAVEPWWIWRGRQHLAPGTGRTVVAAETCLPSTYAFLPPCGHVAMHHAWLASPGHGRTWLGSRQLPCSPLSMTFTPITPVPLPPCPFPFGTPLPVVLILFIWTPLWVLGTLAPPPPPAPFPLALYPFPHPYLCSTLTPCL